MTTPLGRTCAAGSLNPPAYAPGTQISSARRSIGGHNAAQHAHQETASLVAGWTERMTAEGNPDRSALDILAMRAAVYLYRSESKITGTGPERRALAESAPPNNGTRRSFIVAPQKASWDTPLRAEPLRTGGLTARARPEACAANLPSQRYSRRSSYGWSRAAGPARLLRPELIHGIQVSLINPDLGHLAVTDMAFEDRVIR
jgi:hypothetical protein